MQVDFEDRHINTFAFPLGRAGYEVGDLTYMDIWEAEDGLQIFLILMITSMTSQPTTINDKIYELSELEDDWDGYGAIAISDDVVKNALNFVDSIYNEGFISAIDKDDIVPTPYGTIVFDFITNAGMVSIEVGHKHIGFFTEFVSGEDKLFDEISTDFHGIPEELHEALERLNL